MKEKKFKYKIIKKILSEELCNFLFNYLLIKRQVAKTLFEEKYISPYSQDYGGFGDPQVSNTYSCYADIAMETILLKLKPNVEKIVNEKLNENYSYCRIYKKGDILKKHVDRSECQFSCTLHIGGDKKWSIFLGPNVEIILNQGDMLVYNGCDFSHWRDQFVGENYAQLFLHYSQIKNNLLFDNRKHVGLPNYTKKFNFN
jgi:hypothetical protein